MLSELDLAEPGSPTRAVTPATGADYHGGGELTQIALAPDGTLAWILDQRQGFVSAADAPPALLYARTPGGPLIRLNRADTAPQLGIPSIGPDQRTISWTHDGIPRSRTITP